MLLGLRARLHPDERGFTLLETIIAITVVFASLTALAYTATIGFDYMAYARERQAAAGIADQVMEDVRGLAYSKIQTGLSSSDLSGDPNMVTSCAGDPVGTYRFLSCAGDIIVNSSGLPSTARLVPHQGTIALNNVTFSWATYVTNNSPSTTPYRLTVLVTWASAAFPNSQTATVKTQSLFWSPSGCVSNQTHPYAAPCQPFFFGQAQVPRGAITISGSIQGTTFQSAQLLTSGVESNGQQEQVSALQGSYTQSQVTLTDGSGQQTAGGTSSTVAAADTDPGGSTPTYSTQSLASGTGGSLTTSAGSTSVTVSAPSGETARTDAAVTAGGSSVCPPPTDTAETDLQPCSGARIQQGGTLSATMTLDGLSPALGTATLATIAAASNDPNKTFVDRVLVSGEDGRMSNTATRRFGTINIGALPSNVSIPLGWNGYLLSMTGYQDACNATAGTTAAAPSCAISSGTITYWNGTGYTSVAAGTSVPALNASVTQTIGGYEVVVTLSSTGLTGGTITTTSTPTGGGSITRTDVDASLAAPLKGSIAYTITVDGITAVNLTIQIDLGTMIARGVYAPAPAAG